jgi:hypothetical protein
MGQSAAQALGVCEYHRTQRWKLAGEKHALACGEWLYGLGPAADKARDGEGPSLQHPLVRLVLA